MIPKSSVGCQRGVCEGAEKPRMPTSKEKPIIAHLHICEILRLQMHSGSYTSLQCSLPAFHMDQTPPNASPPALFAGEECLQREGQGWALVVPLSGTVSSISLSACCQQHPHQCGQCALLPLEHKKLCSAPPALHWLVPQFNTWACKNQSWALTTSGCKNRGAFFTPHQNGSLILVPRKAPWMATEKQQAA